MSRHTETVSAIGTDFPNGPDGRSVLKNGVVKNASSLRAREAPAAERACQRDPGAFYDRAEQVEGLDAGLDDLRVRADWKRDGINNAQEWAKPDFWMG